mgnify:CR=1 FL=1
MTRGNSGCDDYFLLASEAVRPVTLLCVEREEAFDCRLMRFFVGAIKGRYCEHFYLPASVAKAEGLSVEVEVQ